MSDRNGTLSVKEVAVLFAVSDQTVRRWVRNGDLAVIDYPGRKIRVLRSSVEAMLGGPQ